MTLPADTQVYPKRALLDTYVLVDAFFIKPDAQHFNALTKQITVITVAFGRMYSQERSPVRKVIVALLHSVEMLSKKVDVLKDKVYITPEIEIAMRSHVVSLDQQLRIIPNSIYEAARKTASKSLGET